MQATPLNHIAIALLAGSWLALPSAAQTGDYRLFEAGRSTSEGALINCTGGKPGPWAINAAAPTLVVVHGINPFHPIRHYALGERYGESLARQGSGMNVLAWDWNSRTLTGLRPSVVDRNAVDQGERLGTALLQSRLAPGSIRLVGQSEGCIVATSAARTIRDRTGQPVQQLTLIDPARGQHPILFDQLGASTAALQVEHLWVDGPGGFGKPAAQPGIENTRVERQTGAFGYLRPARLDHFNAVRLHIDQYQK